MECICLQEIGSKEVLIIKSTGWNFIHVIEKDEFDNVIREFEVEVIPETVGQYTGLKDKNGIKIFEGDIIRISQCDDLDITKDAVVSFGEFSDVNCGEDLFCGFYIFTEEVVASILNGKAEGFWFINLCEIIGNIHDNKTK